MWLVSRGRCGHGPGERGRLTVGPSDEHGDRRVDGPALPSDAFARLGECPIGWERCGPSVFMVFARDEGALNWSPSTHFSAVAAEHQSLLSAWPFRQHMLARERLFGGAKAFGNDWDVARPRTHSLFMYRICTDVNECCTASAWLSSTTSAPNATAMWAQTRSCRLKVDT